MYISDELLSLYLVYFPGVWVLEVSNILVLKRNLKSVNNFKITFSMFFIFLLL